MNLEISTKKSGVRWCSTFLIFKKLQRRSNVSSFSFKDANLLLVAASGKKKGDNHKNYKK